MAITTAIFTKTNNTMLTIDTSEQITLVQMGPENRVFVLDKGVVVVGIGVFKVISNNALRVSADADFYVASARGKDVGFPDPPKVLALESATALDSTAVREFFADARSADVP
jgi:hypothetical protein